MSPNPVDPTTDRKIVSPAAWRAARLELLAEEKRLTHELDALAARRRALPWERVDAAYVFEGPAGKQTLADLFRGKSQLIVQHFMLAPGEKEGCSGCSHSADQIEGVRVHVEARDVAFCAVSRAPWKDIEPFKKRMGWTFPWLSSFGSSFNYDYGVSFTEAQVKSGATSYNYGTSPYAHGELPGLSVFYKDASGAIFHTYSAYARGLDHLLTTHHYLDVTPKGRDENDDEGAMRLRHHDRYDAEPEAPKERKVTASCDCAEAS